LFASASNPLLRLCVFFYIKSRACLLVCEYSILQYFVYQHLAALNTGLRVLHVPELYMVVNHDHCCCRGMAGFCCFPRVLDIFFGFCPPVKGDSLATTNGCSFLD